jgi:hypothetical protein
MLQRMGVINAKALCSFSSSRSGNLLFIVVPVLLDRESNLAVSAVMCLYYLSSESLSQYVTYSVH